MKVAASVSKTRSAGMTVDLNRRGVLKHEQAGRTFCSEGCKSTFLAKGPS